MANVLIVDDEEIIRFALSAKLKENGFSVMEACNGRDAVDILHERGYRHSSA